MPLVCLRFGHVTSVKMVLVDDIGQGRQGRYCPHWLLCCHGHFFVCQHSLCSEDLL